MEFGYLESTERLGLTTSKECSVYPRFQLFASPAHQPFKPTKGISYRAIVMHSDRFVLFRKGIDMACLGPISLATFRSYPFASWNQKPENHPQLNVKA